jgi:hypothetical protein
VLRLLPGSRAARLEEFERHILGDAVRMTDIAMRADPGQEVVFVGAATCFNPYASFEA